MNAKTFRKYLDRDGGCLHCGEVDAVSPQHRANRGMGGSKKRDVPSNIIVLCSELNSLIESNAHYARAALEKGWKLSTHATPEDSPVYDANLDAWFLLDDNFNREELKLANY